MRTPEFAPEFGALGRQIRARREERGWDVAAFARRAGCRPSYLEDIEAGEQELRLSTAYRLADALGQPLWMLLIDVEAALCDAKAAA